MRPGIEFIYQSPLFGGRTIRGGYVIDFLILDPPDLAINVQGEFWHYQRGSEVMATDKMARAQMAGQGIVLIFIDESDILEDVRYYVGEALQYRDHSRLG